MSYRDIDELTVAELEGIYAGLDSANGHKKTLKGMDAINALMNGDV